MSIFLPPPSSSDITVLDWVEQVREDLRGGGTGETLNQAAATDATQTTITLLRTLTNIGPGAVLSVGLEQMYVWSTDPSAKTVEVLRGHGGSAASTHDEGTLVRVGGRSDHAIVRALNAELGALSASGLFAQRVLDLTTSGTARTYDLADDVEDVYYVEVDPGDTSNLWPEVSSWAFRPNSATDEFASSNALRLDTAVPATRTLRVYYRARLGLLSSLEDNAQEVTGLLPSALDIPPLGAVLRLTAPAELRRVQTERQGDSRRQEEVPPGSKLRSTLSMERLYLRRVHDEATRLLGLWPPRSSRAAGLV